MLFSSITFLYYFMPISFGIYYLLPRKLKNSFLLIVSLFFYAWGEPKYVLIMLFSIITSYGFGLCIHHCKDILLRKLLLVLSCTLGLGILVYFKYIDFILINLQLFLQKEIDLLSVALPIGISFFTFQTISYTIDVYRKDVEASTNLINYGAYVSMFPQLIAGPIVRYIDIERQLLNRDINVQKVYDGITRFIIGLSKKVIVANNLGKLCDILLVNKEASVLGYWLYAISFSLHIYYDFSAYSDMALGLGKMLGFDFLENFHYPFVSKSITEFWRRWHISLGNWFRDYVYIPLGGNRKGIKRTFINIFIVWMLTGLWHGAAYQFILWGMMFGCLLLIEKLFLLEWLKRHSSLIGHTYTLFFVMISFVLFNATSLSSAKEYIYGLFAFSSYPLWNDVSIYYLQSYLVVIVFSMVGATPIVKDIMKIVRKNSFIVKIEAISILLLLLICTANLVDSSFNPFLYFRF